MTRKREQVVKKVLHLFHFKSKVHVPESKDVQSGTFQRRVKAVNLGLIVARIRVIRQRVECSAYLIESQLATYFVQGNSRLQGLTGRNSCG